MVAPPFPQLSYVERSRLPLDEAAPDRAWLDLIRFLSDPDTTDQFTLARLVANAFYRDDYLILGSPLNPHGTRHGPYRLDCLTVDSFELSDRPSAEETLYRRADQSGRGVDQPYPAPIRSAEKIIEAATTIVHLNVLRDGSEHERGDRRRHCPHRPRARAVGRTDTTIASAASSNVTASTTVSVSPHARSHTLLFRTPLASRIEAVEQLRT